MKKKTKKTSEEKESKDNLKDKKFSFSNSWKLIFIISVLVILIAIFLFINKDKNDNLDLPNYFMYNDIAFAKSDNNLWTFGIKYNENSYGILIHNTPLHLKEIEVIGDLKSFLPSNNTYLSFDPRLWEKDQSFKIALSDFGIKLAALGLLIQEQKFFGSDNMYVCSEESDEICKTIGIKNCEDEDSKVILFTEDKNTYIIAEENCIRIYAKNDEFIKATDRILYSWFNIMD